MRSPAGEDFALHACREMAAVIEKLQAEIASAKAETARLTEVAANGEGGCESMVIMGVQALVHTLRRGL